MPEYRRFDGAELWARLTPVQQASLGAIVLELGVTIPLIDRVDREDVSPEGVDPLIKRPAEAATSLLTAVLQQAVALVVPADVFDAQDGPQPYFPRLMGGICRACACTEYDACAPACSWVAEDLCSACKPGGHAHG